MADRSVGQGQGSSKNFDRADARTSPPCPSQAGVEFFHADILRRRGPVCKDIARVPVSPALAEEDRRNRLQVHLVRVAPEVLGRRWTTIAGETRLGRTAFMRSPPTTTVGPSCHLPWPVNSEVAVGKMAVGPAPRIQLPECAGDSNSTIAKSPSPASRANSPGDVSCGTML